MLQYQKSILQGTQFRATITGMSENAFGEMVRAARERRGLRAYELAALIGRQASFLSRIETGTMKETPAPDVLASLHQHLGLGEADMLRALGYLKTESDSVTEREPDPDAERVLALARSIPWGAAPELADGVVRILDSVARDLARGPRSGA